jgi:hypothetical protein
VSFVERVLLAWSRAWDADDVQMPGKLGSPRKENKQQSNNRVENSRHQTTTTKAQSTTYDSQTDLVERKENVCNE